MINFKDYRLNLSNKVIGSAGISMGIIILIISTIGYNVTSNSLMKQAFSHLQSYQINYTNSLMRFFNEIEVNLKDIGNRESTIPMIKELITYQKKKNLDRPGSITIDNETQRIYKKYDNAYKLYTSSEGYGYKDLYFISANQGHVIYSSKKKSDLGENLSNGKLRKGPLGELWRKVIKRNEFVIIDMKPYGPENNTPAMFAGIPILDRNNSIIAVAALQINTNKISTIMAEGAGIGVVGETYLVGPDKLMRSDSYLDKTNHSLEASFRNPVLGKCDTEPVKIAFNSKGNTGIKITQNYQGKAVLCSFSAINIDDFKWAIISESDLSEVEIPIVSLRKYLMIISIIMIFIALGGLTYIIKSMVIKPLIQLNTVARSIALGDFTSSVNFHSNDEMGDMAESFNAFIENINGMISNVIDASQNLSRSVEQITGSNQNLSQRTTEQAASLEEVVSAIEETTTIITQNADNAGDANQRSLAISKMAEEGSLIIDEAVKAINDINKSSKKIAEINSMINEISFQTNLLALNAAVEAARAGEQGKGFAVVAGEVRSLAQRSAIAAKEIGSLIQSSIDQIDVGTDLVNQSGEALNKIIESVLDASNIINEIATASMEQKQGIEQINYAIGEMDSTTQQNAVLVEETAVASEEMASQAQQLVAMVDLFKVTRTNKGTSTMDNKKSIKRRRLVSKTRPSIPDTSSISEENINTQEDMNLETY